MSNTLSDVQEQTLKVVRQSQQAVVDAVRTWAEAVETAIPELPSLPYSDQLPTVREVVDTSFGFAEQLLAAQHEFSQKILAAAAPVLEKTEPKTASAKPS